jgi:hypothetical protein
MLNIQNKCLIFFVKYISDINKSFLILHKYDFYFNIINILL